MKSLPITVCSLLLAAASAGAQLVDILDDSAPGWVYLHPIDGIDPATSGADPDFQTTWFHQDQGAYVGGSYDGPAFTSANAPFAYGVVDGISPFPPLATPPSGDRYTSYFVKVIDGGSDGYHSLEIDLLADDAAFVYLNGSLIARDGFAAAELDTYTNVTGSPGSEVAYDHLTLIGTPTLNSGSNLLAISVHNASVTSSDLGFGIRIRGIDASLPVPVTLVATTATNWAYLHHLDSSQNGTDPDAGDADFDGTWFDQSLGGYAGSSSYDGPAFTTGAAAPFEYGGVDGIPSAGTTLTTPVNGTRRSAYFLYEVDGGTTGYSELDLTLLADDGAIVYLNGARIANRNFLPSAADTWHTMTASNGDESDFSSTPFVGTTVPLIKPGPNLLAVSVHQTSSISSDLGLKLRLTGQPGLPDIGAVYAKHITKTSAELSWYTDQAGDSSVSYGLAPGSLGLSASLPGPSTVHSVPLSGLTPNTTYYFEVSSSDGAATASESGSFTTLIDPSVIYITRGPYLQSAADDRMTLRWLTSLAGDSSIRYGTTQGSLTQTANISGSRTDHSITLTGLTSATTYFYQVETTPDTPASGDPISSPADGDHFFTTAPAVDTTASTRIWVIGDSGTANELARGVFDAFRSHNGQDHTDVWLMLGDNAYNSGSDSEYQTAVFETYPEIIRNTPIWPTFGNHDSRTAGGAPYYSIFDLPTAGECGGVASGSESYYSFDHGNIHFICLDSQTRGNYDDTLGGTPGMADWLQSDLEATTADWIIAFFHHGSYTKGSHDSDTESHHIALRGNILPILEDYGVDLVLSGHSHCYERSHLLHGHYGKSDSFDAATHSIAPGNGSAVGSIARAGNFVATGGDGAYQKALGAPNIGQVSSIVGSSGKISNWDGGYSTLVNPEPHPVHVANLRLLGSMVIDISPIDNTLHAVFLDGSGAVRDDFSIVKTQAPVLSLATTDATMTEDPGDDNTATFTVSRSGPTTAALAVDYSLSGSASSADYSPPLASGSLDFAIGEGAKPVTVTISADSEAEGGETLTLTLLPRSSAPATFLGSAHHASASLTDLPSQDWWFGKFGGATLSSAMWELDHDGDSLAALCEYGLGGDPLVFDFSFFGPTLSVTPTAVELRYTRDNSKTDIEYRVYTSTDLVNWTDMGITDVVDGTPNPTGTEAHIASIPRAPRRFLTLKVTLP